jgi:hypothetical protein
MDYRPVSVNNENRICEDSLVFIDEAVKGSYEQNCKNRPKKGRAELNITNGLVKAVQELVPVPADH